MCVCVHVCFYIYDVCVCVYGDKSGTPIEKKTVCVSGHCGPGGANPRIRTRRVSAYLHFYMCADTAGPRESPSRFGRAGTVADRSVPRPGRNRCNGFPGPDDRWPSPPPPPGTPIAIIWILPTDCHHGVTSPPLPPPPHSVRPRNDPSASHPSASHCAHFIIFNIIICNVCIIWRVLWRVRQWCRRGNRPHFRCYPLFIGCQNLGLCTISGHNGVEPYLQTGEVELEEFILSFFSLFIDM